MTSINIWDVLLHSAVVVVVAWIVFQYSVRRVAAYVLKSSEEYNERKKKKKKEEPYIPESHTFSTCDVLPSNGINGLIRHTWNFFLEPYLANDGRIMLQGCLERSIEATPDSIIEDLEITELTWGISPPKLSNIALQLLFPERQLKMSFTLELSSTDLHCAMDVVLRLLPNVPAVKCQVIANKLNFTANISVAFQLCNETPGFGDYEVWFEEKPTLDLKLLPLGLPISDIALVSDWLNTSIENIIEASMVQERVVLSMFDMYNRMKVLQEKRIVRVVVHKPLAGRGKGSNPNTRKYCKVKFGNRYKRTYVYEEESSAQWTCLLDFSLYDYQIKTEELLTVTLHEYQDEYAEPVEVGVARVLVSIQGGSNPTLREDKENKNAVQVSVNYNDKTRSCVAPISGSKDLKLSCVRLTISAISSSSTGGFQSILQREQSQEHLNKAREEAQTLKGYFQTSLRWVFFPLFKVLHMQNHVKMEPNYSETHRSIMYRSSAQLINIKKEFDREKAELENLVAEERYKTQIISGELESMKRLRVNQDLRALIEGAKFLVKKHESKGRPNLYHVWYNTSKREICLSYYSKATKPSKVFLLDECEHVRTVIYMNPGDDNSATKKKKDSSAAKKAKNQFLLDMVNNDCWRLEIPSGGNGRSREEWTGAFRNVISGARIS